jgi:hypothetical protein
MQTGFRVWAKSDDHSLFTARGEYLTRAAAEASTGLADTAWVMSPSGNLVPDAPDPTLVMIEPDIKIPATDADRIEIALDVITEFGQIDGDHHKTWVIDQVVRTLTGASYEQWVSAYQNGEDGPDTYDWDEGIAP